MISSMRLGECRTTGSLSYSYRNLPLEAKTVDFTFAVQQSRWVEFTVKPEVGTARREYEPSRGKAN